VTLTVIPDRAPNGCGRPGPTGLVTLATISSGDARYCLCDVGLCPGGRAAIRLVPGRDPGELVWDGSQWMGPSDTGQPPDGPFPLGPAELVVEATGMLGDRPFLVEGRLRLEVTP
jgi:hypothetical protein